jgi:hypothetical protein
VCRSGSTLPPPSCHDPGSHAASALQEQKMATTVCRYCKSELKPGASVCVACGYLHVTIGDVIWTLITGAAILGAFIAFAWLFGALF